MRRPHALRHAAAPCCSYTIVHIHRILSRRYHGPRVPATTTLHTRSFGLRSSTARPSPLPLPPTSVDPHLCPPSCPLSRSPSYMLCHLLRQIYVELFQADFSARSLVPPRCARRAARTSWQRRRVEYAMDHRGVYLPCFLYIDICNEMSRD